MALPELPGELFTSASIITLTGATGAVYVVCGALQRGLNFNPRWLALAISTAIALAGAHATQEHTLVSYLIGLVNGCLIFCTSTGVNSVFTGEEQVRAQPKDSSLGRGPDGVNRPGNATPRRVFTSRWF